MQLEINLPDSTELRQGLMQLPRIVGMRILRTSAGNGTKQIAEAFARNLPVRWGLARDSVTTPMVKNDEHAVTYYIGVKKPAFYIHMLEFGHEDRAGNPVEARHDLQEAMESDGEKAIREARDNIGRAIEKQLRKIWKKKFPKKRVR